jgi:RNA polymerase sigma-54 factor
MKNRLAQNQKLQQKMTLTPKMKHSIQLLGMSIADLNDYIDSALTSNPFLKKKVQKSGGSAFYEQKDIEKDESYVNPRESLITQVRTLDLDKQELEIAEYLIYEMDDNGYIKTDPEDAAKDLFTDAKKVEDVLNVIQTFEPAGIGARDIRECLKLQLKRLGKEDSLEYTIVSDFISDMAINDIPKIAASLGIDKEKIREAVNNIKALNPRPGSTLLSKAAKWAIPDLIASVKDRKVNLELNRESIPQLRLYNPYENKLDIIKDPKARKFLKENMEAASGLIDNIKRREETMCRVTEYVLNAQKEAVISRNSGIKTLTIKDVAEALNLHPSTISRTLSNKYIQINGDVLPLKSFLSYGMKKQNGEIESKTSIKNKILELVKGENKLSPLSDNAIKEKLEEAGIAIKRRTVAKYRESLRILPTHLRRTRAL